MLICPRVLRIPQIFKSIAKSKIYLQERCHHIYHWGNTSLKGNTGLIRLHPSQIQYIPIQYNNIISTFTFIINFSRFRHKISYPSSWASFNQQKLSYPHDSNNTKSIITINPVNMHQYKTRATKIISRTNLRQTQITTMREKEFGVENHSYSLTPRKQINEH